MVDGSLKPGDRLPPQRQLAAQLDVDLTTITRAYDEAGRRNFLEGRGARALCRGAGNRIDLDPRPEHDYPVEHGAYRALERAKADKPGVCLIDIGLPELDGNHLAQRLRSSPEMSRAVLIAVTGHGQESDRKNAWAAGFGHHPVNPVDIRRLAAIVNELAIPSLTASHHSAALLRESLIFRGAAGVPRRQKPFPSMRSKCLLTMP
jgi:CheY-like chemotaxis protein